MGRDIAQRTAAEFFGTFWLTFGGCGAAVLAAAFPNLGIGFLGVAFAFGLTVLTRLVNYASCKQNGNQDDSNDEKRTVAGCRGGLDRISNGEARIHRRPCGGRSRPSCMQIR